MQAHKVPFAPSDRDAVVIRRFGCRDEASRSVFYAAYLVMVDDVTLVPLPGSTKEAFFDDMALLRMIADKRQDNDNATLEEILYFIEMGQLDVVIDETFYPFSKIKEFILTINQEKVKAPVEQDAPVVTDKVDGAATIAPAAPVQEAQVVSSDTPPTNSNEAIAKLITEQAPHIG